MSILSSDNRRVFFLLVCMHATSLVGLLQAAGEYSLTVVAGRDDAIYEVGEEASFLITLKHDGQPIVDGTVTYAIDDFLNAGQSAGLPEGEVTLGSDASRVVITGDRAGFMRCQVTSCQVMANR